MKYKSSAFPFKGEDKSEKQKAIDNAIDDNIGFSEQHNSYYDKDINEIRYKLDYPDVEYEDLQKQYLYEKKGRKKFNSEKEEGKRRRKSMKKKGWGPDYSELG